MADKKITVTHSEVSTLVRALKAYTSDRCRLVEMFDDDPGDGLYRTAKDDLVNIERLLRRIESRDSDL